MKKLRCLPLSDVPRISWRNCADKAPGGGREEQQPAPSHLWVSCVGTHSRAPGSRDGITCIMIKQWEGLTPNPNEVYFHVILTMGFLDLLLLLKLLNLSLLFIFEGSKWRRSQRQKRHSQVSHRGRVLPHLVTGAGWEFVNICTLSLYIQSVVGFPVVT